MQLGTSAEIAKSRAVETHINDLGNVTVGLETELTRLISLGDRFYGAVPEQVNGEEKVDANGSLLGQLNREVDRLQRLRESLANAIDRLEDAI